GSARGGEVAQDRDDIGIARDDPRVEKGVPVNGILGSQARKKGIRIGQNLRIEQAEQAQFGITRSRGTVWLQVGAQGVQHGVAPYAPEAAARAALFPMGRRFSISRAMPAMVG